MRRFSPVTESKPCDNPMCGRMVPVSDNEYYTPQTVVTYDGSYLQFTYCSNRCANIDSDRSSEAAEEQSRYWAHIMATHEDEERMTAAHLAAFIEDEERNKMTNDYRRPRTFSELATVITGAENGLDSADSVTVALIAQYVDSRPALGRMDKAGLAAIAFLSEHDPDLARGLVGDLKV